MGTERKMKHNVIRIIRTDFNHVISREKFITEKIVSKSIKENDCF